MKKEEKNILYAVTITMAVVLVFILAMNAINTLPLTKDKFTPIIPEELKFHPAVWLSLPNRWSEFCIKPWTAFTFIFVHLEVLSLLASIIWFCFWGNMLNKLHQSKAIIPSFIYGGFLGGIAFLLSSIFHSHEQYYLFTSSVALASLATAAFVFSPHYKIFKKIPLWIVYITFLILSSLSVETMASLIAHVVAIVVGAAYVILLRHGYDTGQWMYIVYRKCITIFDPQKK